MLYPNHGNKNLNYEALDAIRQWALFEKDAATSQAFHVAPQRARKSIQTKGFPVGTYLFMEEDQADE